MADKVSVRIPTPLRGHVGGASSVELAGVTVGDVLRELVRRHEKLHGRLFNEKDELNRFVNVFLNDEDIRFLQGLDTKLKDGDGVVLVPAIAGGSAGAATARGPRQEEQRLPATRPGEEALRGRPGARCGSHLQADSARAVCAHRHAARGYLYVTLDGDLLKLAVGTLLVVDAIDSLLN